MPISWPAVLVGLILLTYWIRVMQLVRKTKRQAGHHANLIPEEKLGRLIRLVWTPVIVLWIALPLMAGYGILSDFAPMRALFYIPELAWAALAIAAVAFALTWICWRNMGKSWRMGIDPNEKTQLVLSGPFAYVRHPIYGLSQVLVLMTVLIVPTPLLIIVAMLHVLFMQWEVRREDVYLVNTHGEAYARYQQNVGRFLPRLRPYRP
jgi:protein-S-isoprenylcysteine O-methyltransferase Ste14